MCQVDHQVKIYIILAEWSKDGGILFIFKKLFSAYGYFALMYVFVPYACLVPSKTGEYITASPHPRLLQALVWVLEMEPRLFGRAVGHLSSPCRHKLRVFSF